MGKRLIDQNENPRTGSPPGSGWFALRSPFGSLASSGTSRSADRLARTRFSVVDSYARTGENRNG